MEGPHIPTQTTTLAAFMQDWVTMLANAAMRRGQSVEEPNQERRDDKQRAEAQGANKHFRSYAKRYGGGY